MLELVLVDGVKFRLDKRTGYYLSSRRINGVRPRLHCYIWEKHNGPVLDDFHIHHINHDKSDNRIENLEAVPADEHVQHHRQNPSKETVIQRRQHAKKIQPLTKVWHASEEGRDWHRDHSKQGWEKQRELTVSLICEVCEKPYTTYQNHTWSTRFCSNNCKSTYRRRSGVDNDTRSCQRCGQEYTVNRHARKDYCTRSCAAVARWDKLKS